MTGPARSRVERAFRGHACAMHKLLTAVAVFATAGVLLVSPASAGDNGPLRLGAHMTGAREVPGPGDPDGRGRAQMKVNVAEELFCYQLDLIGLSEVVGGHIHIGQVEESGPIVIDLQLPENGLDGCVHAGRATLVNIARNPQGFYINIHTTEFPNGAIRDQLTQRS